MEGKANLKQQVKDKEQTIGKLGKELDNWKRDIQEDIKREQRLHEIKIERASQDYTNTKEQLKCKEDVFDEQIRAIEDALKSIEEISKTAPMIQGP